MVGCNFDDLVVAVGDSAAAVGAASLALADEEPADDDVGGAVGGDEDAGA